MLAVAACADWSSTNAAAVSALSDCSSNPAFLKLSCAACVRMA